METNNNSQNETPITLNESPLQPNTNATSSHKFLYIGLSIVLFFLTIAGIYWLFHGSSKPSVTSVSNSNQKPVESIAKTNSQGLQLATTKAYGDKYSNGILPVGDGKYVISAAKQGYIYACSGYAQNLKQSQGGASQRGPWFVGTTQYDLNKKAKVQGSVNWQPLFTNNMSGNTRQISTNDLPNHITGIFPIPSNDPAYTYDRNPNSIKAQTLKYDLNAVPSYGTPQCMGGQAGVMLTGVALFNGFDAGSRDAGAWEVQDNCDGHPEKQGIYHYHTLSSCIKDVSVKTVIGFALDGFPITGPKVGENNFLSTTDLDECHGLSSQVLLDGKTITTYHYVMTQDFPYSVSCFRSQPIQPPGLASNVPAKPGA